MSDNSQTIVDLEATPAQAKKLAKSVVAHLVKAGIVLAKKSECTLGEAGHGPGPKAAGATKGRKKVPDLETNGLEVAVERRVFDTGGNGVELKCAACKKTFDAGDGYMEAADSWYGGNDDAEFACPKCGKSRPVAEWDGPFAMGFGNLGLMFWNWPQLSPGFVAGIAKMLGHQVRVVRSHL